MGSINLDEFETAAINAAVNNLNGLNFKVDDMGKQIASLQEVLDQTVQERDDAKALVGTFVARVLSDRSLAADPDATAKRADDGSFTISTK
jgi:hypothetical protein